MSHQPSIAQTAQETSPSPRPRSAWLKAVAWRTLAVLLGLGVAILVAELGLRALGIQPERYRFPHAYMFVDDRWIDWNHSPVKYKRHSRYRDLGVKTGEYIPGAKWKLVYGSNPRGYFDADCGVVFEINSQGFRGPEVALPKPPRTFRILGIGDSFIFGEGVREEDTFLRRIEGSLNRRNAADYRYETVNCGEQGYNTYDEVIYLEHRWLEFEPDVVLISFYLNDAYSDFTFLNKGQALGIYLEQQGLARHSYLVDLVQHAYRVRQQRRGVNEYYLNHYFADADEFLENPPADTRVDWTVSRDALSRAVELSKQHGFRLALVIFPEFYNLDGDYPFTKIHDLVRTTSERLGIPTLDLLTLYRGLDAEDLWVHLSDHHPNEHAHEMAAAAIEQFLLDEGLLEPTSESPAELSGSPSRQ